MTNNLKRHPVLVVNNVRLYHSHAFHASVRVTREGMWRASVCVQFYNRDGMLYHVRQLWYMDTEYKWWARIRADIRFNAIMAQAREGIVLEEVLEEQRRCFNKA